MAKKAKSIVTLSLPKCRKRRYAMLDFICPKTASGSIHRPVSDTFLRCEQFAGFSFVLVEAVVYLDCPPVAFGLVAEAPQGAAFAVLCAVACVFAAVAACGL